MARLGRLERPIAVVGWDGTPPKVSLARPPLLQYGVDMLELTVWWLAYHEVLWTKPADAAGAPRSVTEAAADRLEPYVVPIDCGRPIPGSWTRANCNVRIPVPSRNAAASSACGRGDGGEFRARCPGDLMMPGIMRLQRHGVKEESRHTPCTNRRRHGEGP